MSDQGENEDPIGQLVGRPTNREVRNGGLQLGEIDIESLLVMFRSRLEVEDCTEHVASGVSDQLLPLEDNRGRNTVILKLVEK